MSLIYKRLGVVCGREETYEPGGAPGVVMDKVDSCDVADRLLEHVL